MPTRQSLTTYYSHIREDVNSLLPDYAENVLEIGCGEGSTLSWFKSQGRCKKTFGIEYERNAAKKASNVVDEVICGNIETIHLGERRFDLVLLLDVLEHLVDPWSLIDRLQRFHLAPNALIVTSIPNIRNYRVLKALVFKGEFIYRDAGILDRTHLRFFTRSSALKLLSSENLRVEKTLDVAVSKKNYRRFDYFTCGIFHDFLVYQFLISARFIDKYQ